MVPIGAILSLVGTAASGIMSAVNNRKMQKERDAEYARQQASYEAKANEDPLARSENQSALHQYDRDAKRQVETARNMSVITGATPEYGLAVQKAVAEGRADLMGDISASASARKDKYDQLAERSRENQYAEQQAYRQGRNETYGALAANAASALGGIIDSYTGGRVKKGVNAGNSAGFNNGVNTSKIQTGLQTSTSAHITPPSLDPVKKDYRSGHAQTMDLKI